MSLFFSLVYANAHVEVELKIFSKARQCSEIAHLFIFFLGGDGLDRFGLQKGLPETVDHIFGEALFDISPPCSYLQKLPRRNLCQYGSQKPKDLEIVVLKYTNKGVLLPDVLGIIQKIVDAIRLNFKRFCLRLAGKVQKDFKAPKESAYQSFGRVDSLYLWSYLSSGLSFVRCSQIVRCCTRGLRTAFTFRRVRLPVHFRL